MPILSYRNSNSLMGWYLRKRWKDLEKVEGEKSTSVMALERENGEFLLICSAEAGCGGEAAAEGGGESGGAAAAGCGGAKGHGEGFLDSMSAQFNCLMPPPSSSSSLERLTAPARSEQIDVVVIDGSPGGVFHGNISVTYKLFGALRNIKTLEKMFALLSACSSNSGAMAQQQGEIPVNHIQPPPAPHVTPANPNRSATAKRPRDEGGDSAAAVAGGIGCDLPPPKRRVVSAQDVLFRIMVPSRQIGKVIGKNGTRIQKIRENSKATIKIADAMAVSTIFGGSLD
ncbi:hypothetical protein RJ639_005802 [Escallonia herrerae]|uniref:K Homology domain-containing protein n=1 Tax=Escallonia herrerae TaxID=1293975 RepID=A0AA88VUR3_9ASTE|nr:hypothetical protein RJ639_005802 [Escallonia herrerae]